MALSVLHVHDLRETQLLKIATFALDELDGVESGKELLQNSHMASVDGGKETRRAVAPKPWIFCASLCFATEKKLIVDLFFLPP